MAILRVKDAFAVDQGGFHRVLRPGDILEDTDPVVKGREAFFEPVEAQAVRERRRVETASAAPGEKRTRTVPRKRAARKGATAAKRAPAKKAAAAPAPKPDDEG